MSAPSPDVPRDGIAAFEHTHGRISELVLRLGRALGARRRLALRTILSELREDLLVHFAREEEGLFPYVRTHLPEQADAVDRLAASHDAVCGAVVRLAHLAEGSPNASTEALHSMYERFERAYAAHGVDEAALFQELGKKLSLQQKVELGEIVRGL